MNNCEIISILENMTGKKNIQSLWGEEEIPAIKVHEMGHSQFNELLLSYGCDTVSSSFFEYFWKEGSIQSIDDLREGVDKFREIAMLLYGNIAFGYKTISSKSDKDFKRILGKTEKIEQDFYKGRHDPIYPVQEISGDETRFNGYLMQGEIKKRLKDNPNDEVAKSCWRKVEEVSKTAKYNHNAYLCSDHMDVYVATSMRKAHEYVMLNEFCRHVFAPESFLVKDLKLRWFDPTQACCEDRVEKGLSEALMLKRAKCTIYMIQESDTLGKASEMASTLAQGKTVIAYVPCVTKENQQKQKDWIKTYSENPIFEDFVQDDILRSLAETYCIDSLIGNIKPNNPEFRNWYFKEANMEVDEIIKNIVSDAGMIWDKRAKTLQEDHPLGIQVNLDTGVANGVLVVRNEEDCAKLVRRVMLNEMEFYLETGDRGNLELREKITGCVYRVSSNDSVLVNSFWNYYLV
jgi:hypothetical protein